MVCTLTNMTNHLSLCSYITILYKQNIHESKKDSNNIDLDNSFQTSLYNVSEPVVIPSRTLYSGYPLNSAYI